MKRNMPSASEKLHATRYTLHPSAGFALMFAVLAASVLLGIAVAIFNIALREVILSSFGRESEAAFYAADSGLECALYWDFVNNAFATSTPQRSISCGGADTFLVGGGGDANPTTYIGDPLDPSKDLKLTANVSGPCVMVSVTKQYVGSALVTTARAYGHNTCDLKNPTRVERGVQFSYTSSS